MAKVADVFLKGSIGNEVFYCRMGADEEKKYSFFTTIKWQRFIDVTGKIYY